LIDEEQIIGRVEELGRQISDDFSGDQIVLVTPLKGGVFFLADLARRLSVPLELDFVSAHSYEGDESSGTVRLEKGPSLDLKAKKVLLVEDIIDTGRTCSFLVELVAGQDPEVLKVCSLLDKPARREVQVTVDYVGFTIEDRFVVGYGLDYMEQYRNFRDIFYIEQG
jgi:hypoxanthine phosphoribosyltransferase